MNITELERLLYSFYEISGMKISILDRRLHTVLMMQGTEEDFCSYIHRSPKCLDCCLQSDTEALKKAEQMGGLYTFTCPFGILEAIAPIKLGGTVIAYLFTALGVDKNSDNDIRAVDFAQRLAPNLSREVLERYMERVEKSNLSHFEAYAYMLPIMAQYIESNELMSDAEQSLGQLIKNYINNNLSRKITLADLSLSLHCSTVTLTEHFKREFGTTIMSYVTERRMEQAERLLLGDMPVLEVALACGFSDVEYFSRCFKSIHTLSPVAWRKEQRLNSEKTRKGSDI